MDTVDYLIVITGALVIYTKLLDCISTVRFVKSPSSESNKIARFFMKKYGFKNTIWGVFFFALFVVVFSVWNIMEETSILRKFIFVLIGLIVSLFQFNVAKFNRSKKPNWLIKMVFKWKWH